MHTGICRTHSWKGVLSRAMFGSVFDLIGSFRYSHWSNWKPDYLYFSFLEQVWWKIFRTFCQRIVLNYPWKKWSGCWRRFYMQLVIDLYALQTHKAPPPRKKKAKEVWRRYILATANMRHSLRTDIQQTLWGLIQGRWQECMIYQKFIHLKTVTHKQKYTHSCTAGT